VGLEEQLLLVLHVIECLSGGGEEFAAIGEIGGGGFRAVLAAGDAGGGGVIEPIGDRLLDAVDARGLEGIELDGGLDVIEAGGDEGGLMLEGLGVSGLACEEVAAVIALEGGDVILRLTELAEDIEGAGAERLELVIAEGDEEENGGEHRDGENADEGGAEELAVEFVLRLEEAAESLEGGEFIDERAHKLMFAGVRELIPCLDYGNYVRVGREMGLREERIAMAHHT
jgi:hypothetical protein